MSEEDVKKALETAGVQASSIAPVGWKDPRDCWVVTIDAEQALGIWRQLVKVADQTGYCPAFADDNKIDALDWNIESDTELPLTEEQEKTRAEFTKHQKALNESVLPIATALSQTVKLWEGAADSLNRTFEKVDDILKTGSTEEGSTAAEKARNAARKKADRDLVKQVAMFPLTVAKSLTSLPLRLATYSATKTFESEALWAFTPPGKKASIQNIIDAGEALDVDQWLELKKDTGRKVGDFSKKAAEPIKIPTYDKLILFPVKKTWHIPAVLKSGNWNANPPAHVHVALMKRWHERYDADLITVGRDSVYLVVKRPATTKDSALILAYEHFAYCPDNLMHSGDGTISGGAVDILKARSWQFWWA